MALTPHLGLTLVEQSQAQKEITVNQALSRIDALLNTGAGSLTLNIPPASPSVGDLYIVGSSPSGAWSGQTGKIAYYDTIWRFVSPRTGMTLWVADVAQLYSFHGSGWVVSAQNAVLGAPLLSSVLGTDTIPVIRGGSVYLTTVANFTAYVPVSTGGNLNFSIAGNSGLLGVM